MADAKISALPAVTTPLAGTEVLPIVQTGTTKKVSSDDLTVKNVRSNATTGILQIAGPAVGATRVMTTPDANFTAARTDAAQTFTGLQTFNTGTRLTSGRNYSGTLSATKTNFVENTANDIFSFTKGAGAASSTSGAMIGGTIKIASCLQFVGGLNIFSVVDIPFAIECRREVNAALSTGTQRIIETFNNTGGTETYTLTLSATSNTAFTLALTLDNSSQTLGTNNVAISMDFVASAFDNTQAVVAVVA
jgi:hypothetical protein